MRNTVFYYPIIIACTILFLGATFLVFFIDSHNQFIRREFNLKSFELADRVHHGFEMNSRLLFEIRGFFQSSDFVNRKEWETFMNALDIEKKYPSIKAVEFISYFKKDQLVSFQSSVEKDVFLESPFRVWPLDETDEYYVANYIFPSSKNKKVFGYNLASDEIRRETLETARDTNLATVTPPVRLVQDTDGGFGFILALPFYKNSTDFSTPILRKENLEGFFVVVVEADDFMDSIINDLKFFDSADIDMHAFSAEGKEVKIYSKDGGHSELSTQKLSTKRSFVFGGQNFEAHINESVMNYYSIKYKFYIYLIISLTIIVATASFLITRRAVLRV